MPIALIIGWLALAGFGGSYFGKLSEVSNNDMAAFLPESAESTLVNDELKKFQTSDSLPLIVVFDSENSISSEELGDITAAQEKISKLPYVDGEISFPILSEDEKGVMVVVPLKGDADMEAAFSDVRSAVDESVNGINFKLGGPASFAHDLQGAFGSIDTHLLLVTLSVVFVILLIVYRSPFLPVLVLLSSMVALASAILVVWHLAKNDIVLLNGQTQGILFILVIGAATDYSLLYVARLREEYTNYKSKWQATKAALKGSFEPMLAAGGTVIAGLMCLLFSDLGSNKALGPIGGTGIIFAILASLTFLPALLSVVGRGVFWPKIPRYNEKASEKYSDHHSFWSRVGEFVGKYPRRIWIGTTIALVIMSLGVFQLKADGVPQSEFVLGESEARDAQALLDEHFPAGSGSPTYIVTKADSLDETVKALDNIDKIESVAVAAENIPGGSMPIGKSAEMMQGMATHMQMNPMTIPSPKIVDEKILLMATLKDAPDSSEAKKLIDTIREDVKAVDDSALVGGVTAVQHDTNTASNHDFRLIVPLILVVITIILIVLLRSIVAPLALLLTTVLSFGSAMGVSAIMFNHVWNFPGADPTMLLFGFVFLVALGIDYNIFLMTRVREETIKSGVRKGTIKGLVVTGGVITSAGTVLASTFAALSVIPILFLAEVAFIVAFGVLLDTIIVRSLLVPALTLDIGKKMWWPSKISKK